MSDTVHTYQICNFFLDLIRLDSQHAKDIAEAVCKALTNLGFTTDILQQRLIGVCTDGASNLQGEMRGALSMVKTKMNTNFLVFHCMAHKLELAVHDVLKAVASPGFLGWGDRSVPPKESQARRRSRRGGGVWGGGFSLPKKILQLPWAGTAFLAGQNSFSIS